MKILNALSLQMFPEAGNIEFHRLAFGFFEASDILREQEKIENLIGHSDLDYLVRENMQKLRVPYIPKGIRTCICLQDGEKALVAQYIGPRLPEGATKLPKNARIVWYEITYHAPKED